MPTDDKRDPAAVRVDALTLEIRAHLIRARQPLSAVGTALRLSQTQVSGRFAGRIPWRVAELWKISDLLGIPLADLIAAAEADAPVRASA